MPIWRFEVSHSTYDTKKVPFKNIRDLCGWRFVGNHMQTDYRWIRVNDTTEEQMRVTRSENGQQVVVEYAGSDETFVTKIEMVFDIEAISEGDLTKQQRDELLKDLVIFDGVASMTLHELLNPHEATFLGPCTKSFFKIARTSLWTRREKLITKLEISKYLDPDDIPAWILMQWNDAWWHQMYPKEASDCPTHKQDAAA